VIESFGVIAMICALAGIAQYFAQFAIKQPWLFDFTPWVPRSCAARVTTTRSSKSDRCTSPTAFSCASRPVSHSSSRWLRSLN